MTQNTAEASRPMGFWMALALVMGSMIGSGVFLLPASLAPLGWNSVIGWLITVAGALCVAAVFGALSKALPKAGGPYAYTRAAFGDGFVDSYVKLKMREWNDYTGHLSAWERAATLDC